MPSIGSINGTNLRVYVAGDLVGHATSCSLSLSMSIREILDKDSVNAYSGGAAGQRSASLTFEALGSEDTTLNTVAVQSMATLLTQFNSDTAFAWKFTTDVTGDVEVSGTGFLTDVSINAAVEENATLSGTITVVGAPTFGTVSA